MHPPCLQEVRKVALWDKKERARMGNISVIATQQVLSLQLAPLLFSCKYTNNSEVLFIRMKI